jgi:CubicO group peptidase (beta-lactamase class C family)/predicted esterase
LDGLTRSAWNEHREAIADYAGRTVLLSILRQREGAVLMAYLHELKSTGAKPSPTDTPLIRDHEYHLALKRKILGAETKFPPLRPPQRLEGRTAAVVSSGSERKAGFKPGTARKLREICREWFAQSREPFNMVIARRGVVVLDESFGSYSWGKLTRETPTEMASITKLVTGVLFAQFVDQGLIGIDDPVGKYLPDFPVTGSNVLTLRHCFTHATALDGHEEWGGLHNPWLDNVIANAGDALRPGQIHNYNGMGYDLAGKVMEMVSGKSIFRLMRENLFEPLGMTHTTLEEDLGFSCFSTAEDFARLGQMLLNRGAYGDWVFFSPQTFDQLLPRPLSEFYPAITNKEWGVGITWMRQRHPQAGTNGVSKDATILSRNVMGHGSATAAILRVDLDNELVITQTRRRAGTDYEEHLAKLLVAIESGLQNSSHRPRGADPREKPATAAMAETAEEPGGAPLAVLVNQAIAKGRTGQFVGAKHVSETGGSLPFQIFIPTRVVRGTRYPLLVFLHGAGERGDDNQRQLAGFPRQFVAPEIQAKHPCFAIAPQCPKIDAWSSFPEYPANARSSRQPTAATQAVIGLIEKLIAECPIDKTRIYVTGLSLGGEGTFDIVSRRPDLFAAAVPICGIADAERASSMAAVPFWIFHGDRDEINPVKYSREAAQALKAKGATPIYTEYRDAGHDIWDRAYGEPALIPWLFKQHK